MSLYAFHEKTNTAVEAFRLETDATWMNTQNDKWILPDEEIENLMEVKKLEITPYCSFIKSHIRDGSPVQCHFRNIDDRVKTYNPENESEEHRLAKDFIYYAILSSSLSFNIGGKVLSPKELPAFKMFIEKNIGVKRADVVLIFDSEDEILGKGIAIEIQLSHQNFDKTNKRSFDRALQGYSCVWLFPKHFDTLGVINNELKVTPFRKLLDEYIELKNDETYNRIALYSSSIDQKIEQLLKVRKEIEDVQSIFEKNSGEMIRKLSEKISKEVSSCIEPIRENSKKELETQLKYYLLEIKKEANKNTDTTREAIHNQEDLIKKEYDEAIQRIKKLTIENLNNFNDTQNRKVQEILTRKIDEGIPLVIPHLNNLLNEKLKSSEYSKYVESYLTDATSKYLLTLKDSQTDKILSRKLQEHVQERVSKFDQTYFQAIQSELHKVSMQLQEEYHTSWVNKCHQMEKEIESWIPELKKMAFEFLKNSVKEVINEKRTEQDKDKVSQR